MADPAPPNPTEAAPPPRRRRWFQIHLSTCVVLMFVAGGIVGLNVKPPFYIADISGNTRGWAVYGFPWGIYYKAFPYNPEGSYIITDNLVSDVVLALGMLVTIGVVLEWLIRRRERRHE